MAHRLEDVTLVMYERGFPSDVNSPIFSKPKNTDRSGISGLKFPSYFILAVALGLHNLVKAMLKVVKMLAFQFFSIYFSKHLEGPTLLFEIKAQACVDVYDEKCGQ